MGDLTGHVAVVAGASRGAGRGIALALGAAGATVYVAGRTSTQGEPPVDGAPGSVEETADEVSKRGGVGIPVVADCTSIGAVSSLFARVDREQGRLDVLANASWGMADLYPTMEQWSASMGQPFWEQPPDAWAHMMGAGPHAYFLTSLYAARLMARQRRGLILGVTDGYFGEPSAVPAMAGGQLLWQLSHECINLLLRGVAAEGKKHGIAVVTLMPGFMRTERVVRLLSTDKLQRQFGFERSETTEYLGRAVAALAADRHVMRKSGTIQFVADLAAAYGFTDVDGQRPPRFQPFGS